MTQMLQVRLLGRVDALVDGQPVEVPGRRPRALLAVLALSAGQPVPVEALYERVWGHDVPGDVRANLYTCIRRLRKALGEDAIRNEAGRYALCVRPEDVDAARFTRLLDRARAVGADSEPLLREALDLWQGRPFGDEPLSDWLSEDESRRLTERWLAAVQQRVDLDQAAGRHGDLVAELEQLTAAYPLREPLWARLLVALDRAGRPADALAAYERIRVRLVEELGIDPSPELQALYAGLLRGDSPAVGAATTVPRQLPSDATGFTGRASALAQLDGFLAGEPGAENNSVVIAALYGMGGVGKTTLAVHWAHRVADRFPDGQLFVNLRGHGPSEPLDPAAALDLLLRGLGLSGEKIPAGPDTRAALLRSMVAGRRLLFVLDDARDAEQVRPLLPGSGSMVLVTSRSQLRGLAARDGARRIGLDALPVAEAVALLRSRLVSAPTDDSLAELADLCGRLPLALTIAAERANQQSQVGISDLIGELRDEYDRLDAFADEGDPLADVRAVFSWSVLDLDDDSARLFLLLGLAPGPDLGIEAVAALAGLPVGATRRLMNRLVAASLVGQTDGRYRLHDLVRAYAAEQAGARLAPDERDEARHRLYYWCLRTVTAAERTGLPRLTVLHPDVDVAGIPETAFGDDLTGAAATWMERETELLIAVAQAAVETLPWVPVGIAHALWHPIRWNRSWDEAIALLEVARRGARSLDCAKAEVRALMTIGQVRLASADLDAARTVLEEALALSESIDEGWQARVLSNLALVLHDLGQPRRALECHEQALRIATQDGQAWRVALLRKAIAADLVALSLFGRALAEAEHALVLFRSVGTASDQSAALDTLGSVHHARADYDAAIACFSDALRLGHDAVPRHRVIILLNLGRSQVAAGRGAEARMTLQSAIMVMDENALADSRDVRRAELLELLAAATSAQSMSEVTGGGADVR